jgi:hypothetical protein
VTSLENGRQGLNLTLKCATASRATPRASTAAVGAPPEHRASTSKGRSPASRTSSPTSITTSTTRYGRGILEEGALPAEPAELLGATSSQRINTMVTDVVMRTLERRA